MIPHGSHILALLVVSQVLCAFQPSADEMLASAQSLYSERGAQHALPAFEHALAAFQTTGDRRGEAITLGLIGNCHKHLGDRARALNFLGRALALKRQLGMTLEEARTHNHIGLVHVDLADYAKATLSFNQGLTLARAEGNQDLEARILNNLGLVYDERGDYRHSLEAYGQAAEAFRRTGSAQGESAALGNTGGVYLLLGRYQEARNHYEKALAISERAKLKLSMTQDVGNLALCEMNLGNTATAIAGFDRAIRLAQEGGFAKEEADWHKGKGSALLISGRYSDALAEYALAIRVYEKSGNRQALVEGLQDRGSVYLQLGDLVSAERDFRRALQVSRRIGHPRSVVSGLIQLGSLESRLQRHAEAHRFYMEALRTARKLRLAGQSAESLAALSALNLRQGNASRALSLAKESATEAAIAGGLTEAWSRFALAEATRVAGEHESSLTMYTALRDAAGAALDADLSWRSSYGLGLALEGLSRDSEAIEAYKDAVSTVESVRGTIVEDRYRAGYLEGRYQVYVSLVRLLLRLHQVEQAFLYAEKLRARSSARLMQSASDRQTSSEEKALRSKMRALREALDRESGKPTQERRADAVTNWTSELVQAEREYQNLVDNVRAGSANRAEMRGTHLPTVRELQTRLPEGSALIEYLVSDDGISIFLLNQLDLRAAWTPIRRRDLQSRVELLQDLIQQPSKRDWRKPAAGIWRILIEPLDKVGWLTGIDRLYVVPHGVLNYLPFAVLARPASGRLLVEDYEIAHLPAAAMLVGSEEIPTVNRQVLAMAPARSRLVHAQEEARVVSKFFGDRGLLLSNRQATEQAMKAVGPEFQVLHLATHGYFNALNPLLSSIELEAGGGEDGNLEVHEILRLRLNARLVTLSACQTASGSGYFVDTPAGEEHISLARAFQAAGASAVVSSLWAVNDRSTQELMKEFYRRLGSADAATALAASQRWILRGSSRFRHPYYWAPFILAGGTSGPMGVEPKKKPENRQVGP